MYTRDNLIKLRKAAGYSQFTFGKRMGKGYSKTHISDLENCKADPSFGFIEDFEKFCEEENIIVEDVWAIFKKIKNPFNNNDRTGVL